MKANVLALLAAFAFALGNVLQQKGTLETPAAGDDPRFLVQILRRPVWLSGAACQGSGWVLQAFALDTGSLIVVQSLTTMSLVIALPLGRRITGQTVTPRVWTGAAAMVAGIVLFLSVGSPTGGTSTPPASAWWSAGLSAIAFVVVLGGLGRRRQGATKALLFGSAAGVAFALQSAVTKIFVTVVGQGLSEVLSSWTIYVLIASALVGFVLQQSALKTGVLAPAMASSNAVTLFGSVAFGASVFGESLSSGGARPTPAVIGLGVALVGIVLLAGAKPPQASQGMPRLDELPAAEGRNGSRPSGS
ncbi:MAG: DMT family transporter [Acidimicrobiales bacterium]|nr:DMT family transporter [Acidimicrobiales bacterium]